MFIKFILMQQSAHLWFKTLLSDSSAVRAFYEPKAFMRNVPLEFLPLLERVCTEKQFTFHMKPDSLTTSLQKTVSGVVGMGWSTLTRASASLTSKSSATTTDFDKKSLRNIFNQHTIKNDSGGPSDLDMSRITSVESGQEISPVSDSVCLSPHPPSSIATITPTPTRNDSSSSIGSGKAITMMEALRKELESEKQARLALQIELVGVKHARDVEIAHLKGINLKLQRQLEELQKKE
jgi:hypothetical protein